MRIGGLRIAEQSLQVDLPRRRAKQIVSAHDLVYPHERIVHHHGQLVGHHTVATPHKKVSAAARKHFALWSIHEVTELDGAGPVIGVGHAQARRGRSYLRFSRDLLRREAPACASVYKGAVRGVGSRCRMQLSPRAKARIGESVFVQLPKRLHVNLSAFALVVRTLVPVKPQPAQVVEQQLRRVGSVAAWIEVLYAKHHPPACRPRAQPCHERGKHVARMHAPRRRWRKTPHYGIAHPSLLSRRQCVLTT